MQQNHFDLRGSRATELTEEELGRIQGGNILGDAWNWVENKASDIWNAVVDVLNKFPHPVPLPKPFPPQKPPRPLPQPFPRPF